MLFVYRGMQENKLSTEPTIQHPIGIGIRLRRIVVMSLTLDSDTAREREKRRKLFREMIEIANTYALPQSGYAHKAFTGMQDSGDGPQHNVRLTEKAKRKNGQ